MVAKDQQLGNELFMLSFYGFPSREMSAGPSYILEFTVITGLTVSDAQA